jgi:hypothetical protein
MNRGSWSSLPSSRSEPSASFSLAILICMNLLAQSSVAVTDGIV